MWKAVEAVAAAQQEELLDAEQVAKLEQQQRGSAAFVRQRLSLQTAMERREHALRAVPTETRSLRQQA
jgi:hypothetical protein